MLAFASPATSAIGYAYPAIGASVLVLGFTAAVGSNAAYFRTASPSGMLVRPEDLLLLQLNIIMAEPDL